jgi:hypothetical protein
MRREIVKLYISLPCDEFCEILKVHLAVYDYIK